MALAAVAVAVVMYQLLKRSETEKKEDGPDDENTTKEEINKLEEKLQKRDLDLEAKVLEPKKEEVKKTAVEVSTTPSNLEESFLMVKAKQEPVCEKKEAVIVPEKQESSEPQKHEEIPEPEPEKIEEEKVLVTENELRYQKMEEFYDRIKQNSFPDTPDVTYEDIQNMGENCILIDCRNSKERSYSMLPNAITKEEFQQRKYEILAKDIPIIPYCAIGGRSGKYAKEMKEIYEECDIFNYKGSFIDWCHNGGSVVNKLGEPTKEVWIGNLEDYYPVDHDYIYEK